MAQKSRGSEISSGTLQHVLIIYSVTRLPLFISAFQRAEELRFAMELGGYDANVQERATDNKWQLRDTLSLIMIIPFAIILFVLKIFKVM